MIKVVMLFVVTSMLVVTGGNEQGGLSGDKMMGVSAKYVDNSDEWEAKEFKHDMFADYMPKAIEEPAVEEVVQYTVEEEVYEIEETIVYDEVYEIEEAIVYEEEYIEEEVYVEPEIYEEVIETVEEVYEEPVYSYGATFEATAYAIGDGLTPNTYTRNGTDVSNTIYTPDGYRIIAVDMNVIPLNSIVRVTYSDGTTFLAMACDTGSAVVGNKIDILYGSVGEALNFGRQSVTVEVVN